MLELFDASHNQGSTPSLVLLSQSLSSRQKTAHSRSNDPGDDVVLLDVDEADFISPCFHLFLRDMTRRH